MTALPIIIAPGDPGHIGHHQTLHALLNDVDAPFGVAPVLVDILTNLPAPGQAGRYFYDETQHRLLQDDGTVWRNVTSDGRLNPADPM